MCIRDRCKDSLDLALGVFHSALRLIDVIQNCPVCKEAIKEEICEFQKTVYRNLKVCGDLNIGKLSFEPPQFHLKLFHLCLLYTSSPGVPSSSAI